MNIQYVLVQGPTSQSYACYCGPAFNKFEKKLEKDRKELLKHIDSSHTKLDTKISSLEKKTKDQVQNVPDYQTKFTELLCFVT